MNMVEQMQFTMIDDWDDFGGGDSQGERRVEVKKDTISSPKKMTIKNLLSSS